MKIAISVESTIDVQEDLINKFDFKVVPFRVVLGDVEKFDGEIHQKEIFEYVARTKQLPKTNAVNEFQYKEHFNNILKNYDAIIHISLSSELSSAYSNAQTVAKEMDNVYIIDSRSLSTGIALLAIYARKLIDKDMEINSIVEKIKERIPFVQTSFVLDRLDYLHKGGRCNSLQLLGANLLRLKPQIVVRNGKMLSNKKFRGKLDKAIVDYSVETFKEFTNPDKENVFITYTTLAEDSKKYLVEFLKEKGFKNIYQTTANATITSHCGENTVGILFINDGGII